MHRRVTNERSGFLPVKTLGGAVLCGLVMGLASCKLPPQQGSGSEEFIPRSRAASSETSSPEDRQRIRGLARAQLQPVLRRFDRKKAAFLTSEQLYLERLYLWTLAFGMLEARSNPGTFAGDIPEHEEFPYADFVEAGENLLSDLSVYLERYADRSDPDTESLQRKLQEAKDAVALPFPGSGSRLQDAIDAMHSEKFQAVVAASNPRIARLSVTGGSHVVDTLSQAMSKGLEMWNSRTRSTR